MKLTGAFFTGVAAVFLLTGCYTQFIVADRKLPPAETVGFVVDTVTGDTVKVIKQVDTIKVEDRQTCVWERDLMGYPTLRCYDSFYPRDWFWYNNSPWWYRNDPYWYDYSRCPRFYYYDPSCGCCQYMGSSYHDWRRHNNNPYRDGQVEKTQPSVPAGSTIYPRTQGVPGSGAQRVTGANSNSSTGSASSSARPSGTLIIPSPSSGGQQPRSISERSSGVPQSGATRVIPQPPPSSGSTTAITPPPAAPASSGKSTQQPDSQNQSKPDHKNERRNPRSW